MKFQKTAIILIAILMLSTNKIYAKYKYQFDEPIIKLTRDAAAPVCKVSYSVDDWTNKNVTVTIAANKPVEQVSGFELSADKKVLKREVSQNEEKIVSIRDYAGNVAEVEYEVANLDKEPPQILGCENGGTFDKPLSLNFKDNTAISDVRIDKYAERLSIALQNGEKASNLTAVVEEHPLGSQKYRYYINDELYSTTTQKSYTFTGLKENQYYTVKVQALDAKGNVLDEKFQYREADNNLLDAPEVLSQAESAEEKESYELTESGNYEIKATDVAGNETIYYINVK